MKRGIVLTLVACASSPKPPPEQHQHRHDHHGTMPHRFENADEWAKMFDDPARDAWQQPDRVIASLALDKTMRLADVGAGTGYFTMRVAPFVAEVVATDVEPDMIRYLGERAAREGHQNIRAVATPGDDPKLAAASFDRILVVNVWHHLGDRRAYAAKLAAALKPGGFVAVVDFTLAAKHGPPPEHRLAPHAVIAELEAGGLEASIAVETTDIYVIHARKR